MKKVYDIIVVGGGAAGFFAALAAKEARCDASVVIIEKSSSLLSKVRISGGGRCNVTHACFDPVQLAKCYPRGGKSLIGPFTRFQPNDTMDWFKTRGVELKTEPDGRIFPVSDNSQTIIDCLMKEAKELGVEIRLKHSIETIQKNEDQFEVDFSSGEALMCSRLVLASGSHPSGHRFAKAFGHHIQEPVPSLFTFNIPSFSLKDLAGISMPDVIVRIKDSSFIQRGPILITHWGFSGPAILKLSAWGARFLNEQHYKSGCIINWLPNLSQSHVLEILASCRKESPGQLLSAHCPFEIPKKLWKHFVEAAGIDERKRCSEIGNSALRDLSQRLISDTYTMEGKTTNKEEFVTCGGIALEEVNFKTMESKLQKGLYFCGEILDIDGITGGFNFQNAWTTGWIAGKALVTEAG